MFVIVLAIFMIVMYFYGTGLFGKIKRSSHSPLVKGFLYLLAGSALCVFFAIGFVFIMLGFYRPPSNS